MPCWRNGTLRYHGDDWNGPLWTRVQNQEDDQGLSEEWKDGLREYAPIIFQ